MKPARNSNNPYRITRHLLRSLILFTVLVFLAFFLWGNPDVIIVYVELLLAGGLVVIPISLIHNIQSRPSASSKLRRKVLLVIQGVTFLMALSCFLLSTGDFWSKTANTCIITLSSLIAIASLAVVCDMAVRARRNQRHAD